MVDSALEKRSAWVREGAAVHFSGGQPTPGETIDRRAARPELRAPCPSDNELLYPVSVGALRDAYARAAACFARQIMAGKSWRDVR